MVVSSTEVHQERGDRELDQEKPVPDCSLLPFGPGHSRSLPCGAWEGLRAFLQPLVSPPGLPALLAADPTWSLRHLSD